MHAPEEPEEVEAAAERRIEPPGKEGSHRDHWPGDPQEQDALIVELDLLGREQLRGKEPDALRRARIVDKQTEVLLRRKRQGDLPKHPRAWFRKLVEHGFRSSKIPYGRNHVPLDLAMDVVTSPAGGDEAEQRRRARQDWLRQNLDRLEMSPWQRRLLEVSLDHDTNKAAAAALGIVPYNFRRALARLSKKLSSQISEKFGKNTPDSEPPPPLLGVEPGNGCREWHAKRRNLGMPLILGLFYKLE